MKKLFSILTAVAIAATVNAQTSTSPVVSPAINTTVTASADTKAAVVVEDVLVFKENEFDFGKIPQGKPVTHIFELTNKGKDSLHIVNVQASCGCTTPEWEKDKAVAPNGSSKITVGYNAAAEGPFTKYITITYNGTLSKQIVIKGEVWKTPATSAPENKGLNDLKN